MAEALKTCKTKLTPISDSYFSYRLEKVRFKERAFFFYGYNLEKEYP